MRTRSYEQFGIWCYEQLGVTNQIRSCHLVLRAIWDQTKFSVLSELDLGQKTSFNKRVTKLYVFWFNRMVWLVIKMIKVFLFGAL